MKDEHYIEYTQEFLERQEQQRKKSRRTVFILGWTMLLGAAYTWGHLMGVLLDSPVSLILSGVGGFVIGHFGGRAVRSYADSRGLGRKW